VCSSDLVKTDKKTVIIGTVNQNAWGLTPNHSVKGIDENLDKYHCVYRVSISYCSLEDN
jgi:hypothetical protein